MLEFTYIDLPRVITRVYQIADDQKQEAHQAEAVHATVHGAPRVGVRGAGGCPNVACRKKRNGNMRRARQENGD